MRQLSRLITRWALVRRVTLIRTFRLRLTLTVNGRTYRAAIGDLSRLILIIADANMTSLPVITRRRIITRPVIGRARPATRNRTRYVTSTALRLGRILGRSIYGMDWTSTMIRRLLRISLTILFVLVVTSALALTVAEMRVLSSYLLIRRRESRLRTLTYSRGTPSV